MKKSNILRELPLTHLVYKDNEIDALKADTLTVYHYPLFARESAQERAWVHRISNQIGHLKHPYLLKNYGTQFGVFVATLGNEGDLPIVRDEEGYDISPQRVHYTPALNPIWVRLLFRSVHTFEAHCQGTEVHGRPLIKVDSWKSAIDAISLDCSAQQLRCKTTTEVIINQTNVPLRQIEMPLKSEAKKQTLWAHKNNSLLLRWDVSSKKTPPGGVLYAQISKSPGVRKTRKFLDVSSAKRLEQCWPMILKPIQDEFINLASRFGFLMRPKTLNLEPVPVTTRYNASKSQSKFGSINVTGDIHVLDLRVNTQVHARDVIEICKELAQERGIHGQWQSVRDVSLDNIANLQRPSSSKLLVILDQLKGVEDDRYHLTEPLLGRFAIQHINVNPHDISGAAIKEGYLIEPRAPGTAYITDEKNYYRYDIEDLKKKSFKDDVGRKLEVALKELYIKRVLIDDTQKLSTSLPGQKALLDESLMMVANGCIFTVEHDRPIINEFDPTNPAATLIADEKLKAFGHSTTSILELINSKWPYHYRQQVVMDLTSSSSKKIKSYIHRITLVLHRHGDQVDVLMQDPKYITPRMLPKGLYDAHGQLKKQQTAYPLMQWRCDIESLKDTARTLRDGGELSERKALRFEASIMQLMGYWQEKLSALLRDNEASVTYNDLKLYLGQRWKEDRAKRLDSSLSGTLDVVLSAYYDLPLTDVRRWISDIPGVKQLWCDTEQGYLVVGNSTAPKATLPRQPSIRQWHALQGRLNMALLAQLMDVDWVRMNQLAGNPFPVALIRKHQEIFEQ